MSLSEEYLRQFAWRDWKTALAACPVAPGQKVLDLGCGPGDLSSELAQRGAQVLGVDVDDELIAVARKRELKGCSFLKQDLKSLKLEDSFDGLWCSYTAAYFTNFESVLDRWIKMLKSKSWICLTEIDDLMGHEPLPDHFRTKLAEFYKQGFLLDRYDFRSGHKMGPLLTKMGFKVQEQLLTDKELTFQGPADPEIIKAWSNRLDRMIGLKNFLDKEFDDFKSSFLASLSDKKHKTNCRVFYVVGSRS